MPEQAAALSPIMEQPVFLPATATATSPRRVFEPLTYLRSHRLAAILAFGFAVVVGGYLVRQRLKPVYSAESIVYVSPISPTELADDAHNREYEEFFEQQVYAVTRPDNLQRAIDLNRTLWMFPGEDEQTAIIRLQKALKVEQMGHSYQMSIGLQSPQRDGLADFVNSITNQYLLTAHSDEFFDRDKQIEVLQSQKRELNDQLDSDLSRQDALLAALGIVRIDDKGANNPYDVRLQSLQEQLAAAHEKRDEADAQFYALSESPTDKNAPGSDPAVSPSSDPSLTAIETQLSTRRAELMLKMTGLTPQNPVYIASQAELDSINAQMKGIYAEAADKATGQLLHRYTSERLRAAQLEYQLRDDLSKTQTLAANVTPKLQQAEQLNTEIARLQENSAMVDNRITTLSLENNAPGSEHVVSLASPPTAQVGRHLVLYILLLPILGLITAIAVTFVLDVIDPKVYTGAQIRTLLGFYPIGMLLRKPDFPASLADEYITRLAVGIDQAHRKTGARTFLFTSAGKGSTHDLVRRLGAELVANGLATLVVVVEAAQPGDSQVTTPIRSDSGTDLVRPGQRLKIFRTLGADVEAAEGGCEVVTKSPQTVAEFVRRTRTSYETMLIGADPLLISAHSEHLARVTDGTVVVAESGEVTKKQLTRAARLLERLKIPGIAIVLSQIAKRRADQEILENASEYAQRQGV